MKYFHKTVSLYNYLDQQFLSIYELFSKIVQKVYPWTRNNLMFKETKNSGTKLKVFSKQTTYATERIEIKSS